MSVADHIRRPLLRFDQVGKNTVHTGDITLGPDIGFSVLSDSVEWAGCWKAVMLFDGRSSHFLATTSLIII